mgnify:FL=1
MNDPFEKLVEIIKKTKIDCKFTLVDIGALPIGNSKPRFHKILEYFPSSEIIGFEIEKEACDQMNSKAPKGIKYFPFALGENNEKRKLYVTQDPMCNSLYKPNEEFLRLYHELQYMYLKKETEIETITLDTFVDRYSINKIDFIKIDVQGAELDIFKGSKKLLSKVLKIVCEVEFVPLYQEQPLFGDISKFLSQYNFMFNKFLGLSGRTLKPLIANKDKTIGSQHMWTDAIFIQNINKIQNLSDEKLLKLSVLAAIYNSLDLTFFYLSLYDKRNSSTLATDWMNNSNG